MDAQKAHGASFSGRLHVMGALLMPRGGFFCIYIYLYIFKI